MAEGIARVILGASARVESAGVETPRGLPPTTHAVSVMREVGIDISDHRTRPLSRIKLQHFDLIIAMTQPIAQRISALRVDSPKVVDLDIPDPYGKGLEAYRATAQALTHRLRPLLNPANDAPGSI